MLSKVVRPASICAASILIALVVLVLPDRSARAAAPENHALVTQARTGAGWLFGTPSPGDVIEAELAEATGQLSRLPAAAGRVRLAATVTTGGHWTFVNAAGQRFTAANPAEMARVAQSLKPEGLAQATGVDIVVAAPLLFRSRDAFAALPPEAVLYLAAGGAPHRVRGNFEAPKAPLSLDILPAVWLRLTTREALDEGLWQLSRPLANRGLRILALDVKGPETLPTMARLDPKTKAVRTDRIRPGKLARALPSLRGQTVVISARVDDGALAYRAANGGEGHVALKDIAAAAARSNVNLVILDASAPRQPGDRNWLWQTVTIDGLDDALGGATVGEFLAAFAGDGRYLVSFGRAGPRRVGMIATPLGAGMTSPASGRLGGIVAEVISEVAGTVVPRAVRMDLVSSRWQAELDSRLVPGIPSAVQWGFAAALAAGLVAFHVAWRWWAALWPPESKREYVRASGYLTARAVRAGLFGIVFLPIAGPFALGRLLAGVAWRWLVLPFASRGGSQEKAASG